MISLSHCRSPAQKGAGQQLCLRRTDAAGPVVRGGPRTPPLAGEVGRRVLSLASEVGLSAAPQEVGEAAATAGDRSATLLRPGSSPRHFSVAVSGRGG
jgi:hypothetical protein